MNSTNEHAEESVKEFHRAKNGKDLAKHLGLTSSRFKEKEMCEKAEELINKAKKKDRTYMKRNEWGKEKYHETTFCAEMIHNCPDQIDRIDCADLTIQEFIEKYEKPNKPVIIRGLSKESVNIKKYWTFEEVYQRYKDVEFKIGEDDDGHKIRVKLKYFFEYLIFQKDDSPLYLFESSIEDIKGAASMIKHYEAPKYFRDDILSILGEEKRPPYRWFLIGPERSGTTVHIDPLDTSAWNLSLQGHKRWVLFPQSLPKSVVKAKDLIPKGEDDEAICYFVKMLPKLKEREGEHLGTIEFIQYPGELVFVPGGWWHAVINLDNTMALTQNFMSSTNFERVWRSLRKERKKLSCVLLEKFKKKSPELYQRAIDLNKQDGFIMYNERLKKPRRSNSKEGKAITGSKAHKKRKLNSSESASRETNSTWSKDSSSDSSSSSSSSSAWSSSSDSD